MLTAWTQAFRAADPVTLGLYCGAHDPEALAEQIMVRLAQAGLDPQLLPDLMLCRPEIQLQDLVAAAAVVLVDEGQQSRPETGSPGAADRVAGSGQPARPTCRTGLRRALQVRIRGGLRPVRGTSTPDHLCRIPGVSSR